MTSNLSSPEHSLWLTKGFPLREISLSRNKDQRMDICYGSFYFTGKELSRDEDCHCNLGAVVAIWMFILSPFSWCEKQRGKALC